MAWRRPRFGVRHLMRDVGIGSVSKYASATIVDGDYLAFVLDERRELLEFTAASGGHYIQVDAGTGYASTPVDRIVIPYGHNYNGQTLRVRQSAASDMSSPDTLLSQAISAATQIDETMTESTKRYLRVDWNAASFNPDTPEIWLTKTLAPGQSAEPDWPDHFVYNVLSSVTPAGDRGDLVLGAKQRVFELQFTFITNAADIAILDQLVEDVGMDKAFIFDPPFDDEAALICKMAQPPTRQFSHPAPADGSKAYDYHFVIVEQLV